MKRYVTSLFTILCLMLSSITASALDLTSNAAIVIDAKTGKCFYELNPDTPLAPASMTKVMTVYLAYEKISEGYMSMDTVIVADEEDAYASRDSEYTNVELNAGEGYTVSELIDAILIPSACAASEMLGKHISGSREAFAELMNRTVGELGLEAYYEDASGASDNNRISARSMAKLARILINKYPDVLTHTQKSSIEFHGRTYKNTNRMLPGGANEYPGTDGLKTGTTTLAGCCFTGTSAFGGNRLISVTMHSASGSDRFLDTINLMEYGRTEMDRLYNDLFATDMRLFINGNEVPAFVSYGHINGLCFIIEDLKDYGFDVSWNGDTSTVTAVYDPDKPASPIPMEHYRGLLPGSAVYPILQSNIRAELVYNGQTLVFDDIAALNGYTAVSADALGAAAESCFWDDTSKTLNITL